ncbi:MAG: prolipoprotein diacylglyceryl transferase, partial [Phycisphaerae bacterium]|nr:prolipoprotein diacylglyceryl transferase [Phycisphaerae bacterium]
MQRIIVDFGVLKLFGGEVPLRIYGYGLMLVLGFLSGIWLAQWRARRCGGSAEAVAVCGILALVGGVIGARLAYMVENYSEFAHAPNPLTAVLNVTSGGLIYYGGVVLATVFVLAYLRLKRLSIRRYLDILSVSLMVGLAFGRAGCLLNGCCFGRVCSETWPLAMRFPMYSEPLIKLDGSDNPFSQDTAAPSPVYDHQLKNNQIRPHPRLLDTDGRLIPPRDFTAGQVVLAEASWSRPVKPAQALGLISALVLAALLMGFYRLRTSEGQVFALLLVLYPITRFVLEAIRDTGAHDLSR